MVSMETNHHGCVCVCVYEGKLSSNLLPLPLPEGSSVTSRPGSLASGHFYVNYSKEFQKVF